MKDRRERAWRRGARWLGRVLLQAKTHGRQLSSALAGELHRVSLPCRALRILSFHSPVPASWVNSPSYPSLSEVDSGHAKMGAPKGSQSERMGKRIWGGWGGIHSCLLQKGRKLSILKMERKSLKVIHTQGSREHRARFERMILPFYDCWTATAWGSTTNKPK